MAKRRLFLILIDTVCYAFVCFALFFVFFGNRFDSNLGYIITHTAVAYVAFIISRIALRVYQRVWRYAGYNDFARLAVADSLAGLVTALINRFIFQSEWFLKLTSATDIAMKFIEVFAVFSGTCVLTLALRFFYQHFRQRYSGKRSENKIKIAIVGAGSVGVSLAKELLANKYSKYEPVVFVDSDKYKIGSSILDIPVIEESKDIVEKLNSFPVQEIVIAIPRLSGDDKQRVYNLYQKTGSKVKIFDHPLEASSGGKRTLREFKIEDLLQRSSLDFCNSASKHFYSGKTILISGGGGSIGSELCRQIAAIIPKKLIILDIYENNAYDIQQMLIRTYGQRLDLSVEIASIRDCDKIDYIFNKYRPQIVLHAAAHKHVPLMEDCPSEAIKNNIFGTLTIANAAEKYGAEKFIMISTDKAVNPTNVMGATKRVCEMIIQSKRDSKTEFAAVRFGNVLGSNGSVIPLFKRQIENGGPITITDKRIIRYFMTIPEAAQLVLEAGAMASKSEIYVLDMGKPVKILELAENMIRLSGLTPYVDVDIEEVGLRPGEKLYEELLVQKDKLNKTDNSLIFIEKEKGPEKDELEEKLAILKESLNGNDNAAMINALKKVVPTYHSPEAVNSRATESTEMTTVVE